MTDQPPDDVLDTLTGSHGVLVLTDDGREAAWSIPESSTGSNATTT